MSVDDLLNEKSDYPYPQETDVSSLETAGSLYADHGVTAEKRPSITFEHQLPCSGVPKTAVSASSRKHSYASVKEDAGKRYPTLTKPLLH